MEALFLKILNMSVTASYVITAVLLIRLLLRKAPKKYSYLLWSVVGFRLCCPVSFRSAFSLFSLKPFKMTTVQSAGGSVLQYVPENIGTMAQPQVSSGIPSVSTVISNSLPAATPMASADPMQLWVFALTVLWCVGMASMLIYSVVAYIRLYRLMTGAMLLADNVWQSDKVQSPFIFGIYRPKIFIPFGLDENTQRYVLTHEGYHLKRYDHIIKSFAFLLLMIHWFNPLCWLAFYLMGRDMEMSCDEKVLASEESISKPYSIRKAYSTSLLSFASNRRFPSPSPLAFGETGVKCRIRNALGWKRPKRWITLAVAVLCIAVMAACVANPKVNLPADEGKSSAYNINTDDPALTEGGVDSLTSTISEADPVDGSTSTAPEADPVDGSTNTAPEADPLDAAISAAILEHNKGSINGDFACESHVILATEGSGPADGGRADKLTVYAMALYQKYSFSDGAIRDVGGSHIPVAITFDVSEVGKYTLAEYWEPRDGSYYARDIRKRFPEAACEDALDTQKFILAQIQSCYAQAVEYRKLDTDAVIGRLFDTIMSSPAASSNPSDYIEAHSIEYRELTYYGNYTLRYVYSEFLKGGQTGLKGNLMRIAMNDLIGIESMKLDSKNGQEYFDAWLEKAQQTKKEYGLDYMKENKPKAWMLLQMLGD